LGLLQPVWKDDFDIQGGNLMLVGDRMSQPVITITPHASLDDAWQLMSREKSAACPWWIKRGR